MILRQRLLGAVAIGGWVMLPAPAAHAAPPVPVTYEVISTAGVPAANVEFFDGVRRQALTNVSLPWHITVMVPEPTSSGTDVAEIRADWRWLARPNGWVTTRVYLADKLRCENTLDVGDASCYGNTTFNNA